MSGIKHMSMTRMVKYQLGAVIGLILIFGVLGATELLRDESRYVSEYRMEVLSSSVSFEQPVAMESIPGTRNGLFVLERSGRIFHVPDLNAPEKMLFLDLKATVSTIHDEAGLLGLAFHPDYDTNQRFFVYRTHFGPTPQGGFAFHYLLSEFQGTVADSPETILASEKILIAQPDPDPGHNAGTLRFGPDGYLYFSVGDTGPRTEDLENRAQRLDGGFFRSIFRIDVDNKPENLVPNPHPSIIGEYRVPADNPLVGKSTIDGFTMNPEEIRTEVWVYGLRNPWKFSFHPEQDFIVIGEVGASRFEEINIATNGGLNFGWPFFEGDGPGYHFQYLNRNARYTQPYFQYPHGYDAFSGNSVIAGYFYQGENFPGLKGKYILGDFNSGNVWALNIRPEPQSQASVDDLSLLGKVEFITSLGIDPRDEEILICNFYEGLIYKLVPDERFSTQMRLPEKLSETQIFKSLESLEVMEGLTFYQPNVPFWSDGLEKSRWISTPAPSSINFTPDGTGVFPDGTVFIKHFDWFGDFMGDTRESKPVETRIILKKEKGVFGATYEWNPEGTEAFLVPEDGKKTTLTWESSSGPETRTWLFPSRTGCNVCHNSAAGYVLGFREKQLNDHPLLSDSSIKNQLQRLYDAGILKNKPATSVDDLVCVPLDDERFSLAQRFKSYTHSNCRSCHTPGGKSRERWDARIEIRMSHSHLLNVRATPPLNLDAGKLIDTATPEDSELLIRIEGRHTFSMPPVATFIEDKPFFDFTRRFLNNFSRDGWNTWSASAADVQEGFELDDQSWFVNLKSSATENKANPYHWIHNHLGESDILAFSIPGSDQLEPGFQMRVGSKVSNIFAGFTGYQLTFPDRVDLIQSGQVIATHPIESWPEKAAYLLQLPDHIQLMTSHPGQTFDTIELPQNNSRKSLALGFGNYSFSRNTRLQLGAIKNYPIATMDIMQPLSQSESAPRILELESNGLPIRISGLTHPGSGKVIPLDFSQDERINLFLPPDNYADSTWVITPEGANQSFQIPSGIDPILESETAGATIAPVNEPTFDSLEQDTATQSLLTSTGSDSTSPFLWNLEAGDRIDDKILSISSNGSQTVQWFAHALSSSGAIQFFQLAPTTPGSFSPNITVASAATKRELGDLRLLLNHPGNTRPSYLKVQADASAFITVIAPDNQPFAITRLGIEPLTSNQNNQLSAKNVTRPGNHLPHIYFVAPESEILLEEKPGRYLNPASDSHQAILSSTGAFMTAPLTKDSDIYAMIKTSENEENLFSVDLNPSDSSAQQLFHQGSRMLPHGSWNHYFGNHMAYLPFGRSFGNSDGFDLKNMNASSNGWLESHYTHPNLLADPETESKFHTFWFGREQLSFELHAPSDEGYQLSLYFMDVILSGPRSQLVSLIDLKSGTGIDEELIEVTPGGRLYSWTLKGDVKIEMNPVINQFALLSGIFIDPTDKEPAHPELLLHQSDSHLYLGIFGQAGIEVNIQSSSDLIAWENSFTDTLNPDGLSRSFKVNLDEADDRAIFYRAAEILPPEE